MTIEPVRLFTVREANTLIKQLTKLVGALTDIRDTILHVQGKVEVLHLLHGKNVLREDNADHGAYLAHRQELESLVHDFNAAIAQVTASGAVVKDVDLGLIDFHTEHKGQLAYLCWQTDEPEVGYWHPLSGGYSSREPLGDPETGDDTHS